MDPPNQIKVSCESCGLLTKIEKTHVLPPCSQCGGTLVPLDAPLRAELTPPPEPLKGVTFCSACDASNPVAARFCENCGQPLVEQVADAKSPRRHPKARSRSLEKRQANIELGKAYTTMKRVRGLFIFLAALSALQFFLLLALRPDVPGLLVGGAVVGVLVLGAVFLQRQPFAWTLVLACLMTLAVLLTILGNLAKGEFTLLSIPWLWIILTIACWTATTSMLNVKVLLAQHGDTVGAERFTGKRKRVAEGEISTRVRGRAHEATGRSAQKVAIYGAAVVLAVVVVVTLVVMLGNGNGGGGPSPVHAYDPLEAAKRRQKLEDSYEPVLERFLAAWRASDKDAIAGMASPGARQSLIRRLEKSLGLHELPTDKLPEIRNRRDLWLKRVDGVKTYFSVPATEGRMRQAKLRLHWVLSEDEWVLVEARLRGTTRDD